MSRFEMSDRDLTLLIDFVYNKTGIRLDSSNRDTICHRMGKRMDELEYTDVFAYLNYMKFDTTGVETRSFLDLLTTNETYFYRDLPQLMVFCKKVMPAVLERRRQLNNGKRIKIWSAACSVGCEAYTLALLLREELPDFKDWTFEIIGTDISISALQVAKDGLYTKREVSFLPSELQRKYFKQNGDYYNVSDELRSIVSFRYMNLIDDDEMRRMHSYDIVFCRNVLIYFDDDSREQVLDNLYESMTNNAYIFLGHSEFLSNMSQSFKMERMGKDIVYKKEED